MDIEKIVREYIDKCLHMSLATAVDNSPWICEVHFVYDKDLNLYFRSLGTRRHSQEIAQNPNVAGNIVKQHTVDEYPHAIYFEGQAYQVTDKEKQEEIFPLFKSRLLLDKGIIEEAQQDDGHKFYKIVVDNWFAFGKFGGTTGKKYKLEWRVEEERQAAG